MLFVREITFALVGFCCFVSSVQHCFCIDYNNCTTRNGTVSKNSTEESPQCPEEKVTCCNVSTEEPSVTDSKYLQDGIQEPKASPGEGCGRKRFSTQMNITKDEKPSSKTLFYGEVPWVVAILDKNLNLRCSGTLIYPKVVLTAAHCLSRERSISNLFIRAGYYAPGVTNKPQSSQLRRPHKLVYHSGYDEKNFTNDIAIIILDQPMLLNAMVDVICTPEEGKEFIATECILSGFGSYSKNGSLLSIIKKINYTYKSQEYCLKEMKTTGSLQFYHKSNICGLSDEEDGARNGDGGGPLFCPLKDDPNKMVQIGIVSWQAHSKGKVPTAFTSVKHHLPWLRKYITELS
ncbi:unnamed protein product [Nezara viridula]|uniref:Peptidase S1 domain-containing protein n=1 Tax=Nezara viridula TaxID=85310 RepID=A0A9P0MMJ3_NEZVI|nr:unnamed protein product [Nezara viridula]